VRSAYSIDAWEMPPTFAEILEAADQLSLDDQAELIEVLRHRVAERRQDRGPQQGLSSLAGGWEGSDELVERLAEIRRSGPMSIGRRERTDRDVVSVWISE